jgi:polar amino acid transport system substrate-binding protein
VQTLKNILFKKKLFIVLSIIVGVAALIGGILYLLEHKKNDKIFSMNSKIGRLIEAVIAGLPFVTSGPIRYYEFRTLGGRALSAVLAVGSTIMIASITALLASAFTLDQMHSEITGPQDLAKVRVGAMEDRLLLSTCKKKASTAAPSAIEKNSLRPLMMVAWMQWSATMQC